jgi:UDP-hydrolysing UDP-N-acetyl-D-glucosamine 2-epimerase
MKRVVAFVGSRANYGRLYSLLDKLADIEDMELHIITSYYNMQDNWLQDLVVLKIDSLFFYDTTNNMVQNASMLASQVSTYFNSVPKYDLAIVHGDRFENLGFAVAASYNGIPLLHTEGGEDSGNIDDKVRYAITALADYHFVTTDNCAKRIIWKDNVHVVGSMALDMVRQVNALSGLDNYIDPYYLVMYNPCLEDNLDEFFKAIVELSKDNRIIWVNPNIDPGYKSILKKVHSCNNIEFVKDLNTSNFLKILASCTALIGNTSAGIKEGAFLQVPYILVGERQVGREVDVNVRKIACSTLDILSAIDSIEPNKYRCYKETIFGYGYASSKAIRIIKEVLGYAL